MSSDEDYMSDKFLDGMDKNSVSSLLFRHSDKRKIDLFKKKSDIEAKVKENKQSLQVIEAEKREEGLSSAISSDNKGFAMLAKMGYKPGEGVGKSKSGIKEPISVEVKANRFGLGNKKVQKKSIKHKKQDEFNISDYRSRVAQKKSEHLAQADLYKSQRICEELDMESGVKTPKCVWYWPPIENSDSENEESDDEIKQEKSDSLSNNEKLEIITKYLREKYFYCIWCGVKFENEDDLRDNCPGNTRNEH